MQGYSEIYEFHILNSWKYFKCFCLAHSSLVWDLLWRHHHSIWEEMEETVGKSFGFFLFELLWFVPTASDNILKPTDTTTQRLTIRLMSRNFSAVATQQEKNWKIYFYDYFRCFCHLFERFDTRGSPFFSLPLLPYIFTSVMFVFWIDNSRLILYTDRPTLKLFFFLLFRASRLLIRAITDMRLSCIKQSRPTRPCNITCPSHRWIHIHTQNDDVNQ